MGKPFNVVLTEAHREALEAIRRHEGLRSEGDVIRMLIERRASSGLPTPEEQAAMKKRVAAFQGLAAAVEAEPKLGYDQLTDEQRGASNRNAARYAADDETREWAKVQLGPVERKPGSMLKKGKT